MTSLRDNLRRIFGAMELLCILELFCVYTHAKTHTAIHTHIHERHQLYCMFIKKKKAVVLVGVLQTNRTNRVCVRVCVCCMCA